MSTRRLLLAIVAATALLPTARAAAQDRSHIKPLTATPPLVESTLFVAIGFGGDELAYVTSTAGTYSLNAGDGSGVGVGVTVYPVRRGRHSLGLAADLGYTRAGVQAGNGKLHTRRVPVTLLAQYHLQTRRATRWQFGLGLASHRGVRLTEESAGFRDELDLDSTIGWHVAVGVQWYATKRYGVELDVFYESIRHEVPSSDIGVDASSLGLSLRFVTNVL